ncbi:NTP transferase domain-containing protein [Myxococcota bacterium]|nr:NTP transferase domain-containing protein [Myxococcota bacterium]
MATAPKLHAVILAGGAGERFWPASRQAHPKPFLRVDGEESLIQTTVRRARRFAGRNCVWVVCGREHAREIRKQTGLPSDRIIVEPRRRNTAMAIAFSTQRIAASFPDAVLAVLSADHLIPDERAFAEAIRKAARAAREAGVLVTLGVQPSRPEPGYGYIQVGRPVGRGHPGLRSVRRFVEKPDLTTAKRYLKSGDYLWNAGIFVWTAQTLLGEVEGLAPALHAALVPLEGVKRPGAAKLRAAYDAAPSEPIDIAIMERSSRVWTLPVKFRWSDVGTWESLALELGVKTGTTVVVDGDLAHDDRGGNLVWSSSTGKNHRTVALLGVEGLAVIDTGDALLVARLDQSPEVRNIVKALKADDREDLT